MTTTNELQAPLTMMGAPGSPYTRKMRGLLRYRRIPYVFVQQNSRQAAALPKAKVPLLPTFYLPDASGEIVATTDSTPLIRRFEAAFSGRSVIPPDPALRFLDELIEDYADEWLTKCMFHYRWYHEADATKARRVLPHWGMQDVTDEEIAPIQKMIGDRQIERLRVVGSNEVTAPVIEASYVRFLDVFDAHLQDLPKRCRVVRRCRGGPAGDLRRGGAGLGRLRRRRVPRPRPRRRHDEHADVRAHHAHLPQ